MFMPMLFEIFMYTLIIALSVLEMINSTNDLFSINFLSRIQLVMCALVDFLIFSWRGEELTTETVKIRERIYSSKWYLLKNDIKMTKNYKVVRSLLVINMMNARGVVIKAGGLFDLRLETYVNVSGIYKNFSALKIFDLIFRS